MGYALAYFPYFSSLFLTPIEDYDVIFPLFSLVAFCTAMGWRGSEGAGDKLPNRNALLLQFPSTFPRGSEYPARSLGQ
jgi:hypothetical protein